MKKKAARPINKDTLPSELKAIVANVLDRDESELREDVNLVVELDVDSVMLLEILVILERTYGIKVAQDDLKQVRSLRDMASLLLKKAEERGAEA